MNATTSSLSTLPLGLLAKDQQLDALDCKEIKPVNPKGNQSWIFIGRIDTEAETSLLWSPDEQNWFVGKDPVGGKDWW